MLNCKGKKIFWLKEYTKFRLELYLSFCHNTKTIWSNWCVLGRGTCEEDGGIKHLTKNSPFLCPCCHSKECSWEHCVDSPCLPHQASTHTYFPILEICASKRTNNMIPVYLHFNWTCKWNLQTRRINCISWLDSILELHLHNADYANLLKLIWAFL